MDPVDRPAIPREISEAVRALAQALAGRPEVARLREAREEIGRHEAARIMLKDLRERQRRLAEKSRRGETPSPQEMEELQRVAEVVGFNPYIRALMEAEVAYAGLMGAVVEAIEQELGLPPEPLEPQEAQPAAGQGQEAGSGRVTAARPRLWVPGQP